MIFFSLGSSNGEQIFVNFSHDLKSWPPDIICNSKNLKKKVYIGTGEMYQFSYNPSDGKVDCKVKYTVSFKCLRICICIFLPGLPYLFEDHHLLRLPAGPLWLWQPRNDGQVRHHKLWLPWVMMTQWTLFMQCVLYFRFCNGSQKSIPSERFLWIHFNVSETYSRPEVHCTLFCS